VLHRNRHPPILEMFYDNVCEMENDPDVLAFAAINTGLPPDETLIARGELVINAGMGSTNKELKASKIERSLDRCVQLAPVDPSFIQTAKELFRDLLPLNGAKNVDRYLPPSPQQGQLPEGRRYLLPRSGSGSRRSRRRPANGHFPRSEHGSGIYAGDGRHG